MRTQVMSYGGGVQTVAMVVAVLEGRIGKPDMIVAADTGRERSTTWAYMNNVVNPALSVIGMTVEVAPHSLATVDLYAHNDDLLVPGFTATGKLPTFCSDEWKQRPIMRYLRAAGVKQCDVWIGFSADEEQRAKPAPTKWYQRRFPLLELGMNRADCRTIIEDFGWPLPSKSACYMCPNMTDVEWVDVRDNSPEDFQKAIELEQEIIEWDNVYLHSSCIPLDEVEFRPESTRVKQGHHQCSMGYCWV